MPLPQNWFDYARLPSVHPHHKIKAELFDEQLVSGAEAFGSPLSAILSRQFVGLITEPLELNHEKLNLLCKLYQTFKACCHLIKFTENNEVATLKVDDYFSDQIKDYNTLVKETNTPGISSDFTMCYQKLTHYFNHLLIHLQQPRMSRLLALNEMLIRDIREEEICGDAKKLLLKQLKQHICTLEEAPSSANTLWAESCRENQIKLIQRIEHFFQLKNGWQEIAKELSFMEILKEHHIYPEIDFNDSMSSFTFELPIDEFIVQQERLKNTIALHKKFSVRLEHYIEALPHLADLPIVLNELFAEQASFRPTAEKLERERQLKCFF